MLQEDTRALWHIQNIHRTPPATYNLRQYHVQPRSHMDRLAAQFNDLTGPPSSLPPASPPRTSRPERTAHIEIPGVGKKAILPDVVLRPLRATQLAENFSYHLFLFTNASVTRIRNSTTAAAAIRALGHNWSRHLYFVTTYTMAASAAIRLSLWNLPFLAKS